MYFFVRFTGIVILVSGVLLMLLGFGGAIYGFVQGPQVVALINQYIFEASQSSLRLSLEADTRFFTSLAGLVFFVFGMGIAAMGQLMLVFADIASNTHETNLLLRGLRRAESAALARLAHEAEWTPEETAALAQMARPADAEPARGAAPVPTAADSAWEQVEAAPAPAPQKSAWEQAAVVAPSQPIPAKPARESAWDTAGTIPATKKPRDMNLDQQIKFAETVTPPAQTAPAPSRWDAPSATPGDESEDDTPRG